MLTKDGICILVNVVIADSTQTYLLQQSCTTKGFVAFNAAQAKKQSSRNRHLVDQFRPLAMEVFGCLHKKADVFLHNCANVIWSLKRPNGPPFFILVTFLWQKISITL
jgi:hypothetical protein